MKYMQKRLTKVHTEYNQFNIEDSEQFEDSERFLELWDKLNNLKNIILILQGKRELAHSLHNTHLKILDAIDEIEDFYLKKQTKN
jgi:hypothetical protein